MNWYQQLFQAGRWPGRLPHYAAALEAWIDRLDELNIGHTGIRRRPNGPYSTVVFRDHFRQRIHRLARFVTAEPRIQSEKKPRRR